ncbi:transcriptional regulator [Halorubellus sp. PRR65]|uniref:transcriptional regulator n=1 Tax=Halorubellus sp. PRR65 TaxID=3098148 RepID=UPI002B259678|nr:transcriptional regulator [Halorubellus sp. PRR65]
MLGCHSVPPHNDLLDAITHVQRRKLLREPLIHNPQDDEPVVVDADQSAAEELTRLIEMRHAHLPLLEEYGFIVWNQKTNEVSKGRHFEERRPLLELVADHEDELPDGWL